MAVCEECERQRRLMRYWAEALAQWTMNPTGPSINQIYREKVNLDQKA